MAASPSRWSSSATCAHAVVVSVLTQAETLFAARRLAGALPHLAAVAGLVHHEDLWQLCREGLTGVYVRTRRLGYLRPLVRRGRRGHAEATGVATRRFADAAVPAVYKTVVHARDHHRQQNNSAQLTRITAAHWTLRSWQQSCRRLPGSTVLFVLSVC